MLLLYSGMGIPRVTKSVVHLVSFRHFVYQSYQQTINGNFTYGRMVSRYQLLTFAPKCLSMFEM